MFCATSEILQYANNYNSALLVHVCSSSYDVIAWYRRWNINIHYGKTLAKNSLYECVGRKQTVKKKAIREQSIALETTRKYVEVMLKETKKKEIWG